MDEQATEEVMEALRAAWDSMETVQGADTLSGAWRRRAVTIQRKINDLHHDIEAIRYYKRAAQMLARYR